jgi:hypothetical protein
MKYVFRFLCRADDDHYLAPSGRVLRERFFSIPVPEEKIFVPVPVKIFYVAVPEEKFLFPFP